MAALKNLCALLALAGVVVPANAQRANLPAVRRVAIVSQDPLRLQIVTNPAIAPQTQVISGPERLVIDFPNTVPGAALRGIAVNRGEVKGVRVGLFSNTPPVTRVVVDLNSPQSYHIVPNATGFVVSLGDDTQSSASAPTPSVSTIGWVSAKPGVKVASAAEGAPARKSATPAVPMNGVSVNFANGLLSIHANGATLSAVLFEVQKQTGAEIAIPAGTEQDRVAADFGPGPSGEVLGELLNGSGLNFVVVGSETDPRVLRSVILSRKSESSGPVAMPQTEVPDAAENVAPDSQEPATPPDENLTPPQPVQPPPDAGSAAPPPTQRS